MKEYLVEPYLQTSEHIIKVIVLDHDIRCIGDISYSIRCNCMLTISSLQSISAPFLISNDTNFVSPIKAAACSGVPIYKTDDD